MKMGMNMKMKMNMNMGMGMNIEIERYKQNPLSLWERVRNRLRKKLPSPQPSPGGRGGTFIAVRRMATALLLCLFLSGCGNRIPVTPVTGTVTLNGESVENAVVTFIPDTSPGTVATATTDKEGKYELKTYLGNKTAHGAFPGNYKVTVVKRMQTNFPDLNLKDLTPEQEEALSSQVSAALKGRAPKYEYLVPQKYESQATSGLTAEVPAKGKYVRDFELN